MLSIVTLAPGTKFRRWTDAFLAAEWGSAVARGGELVDPTRLEGVVALRFSEPVGAATYLMQADALEIVTLNATVHRLGVGRMLVDAVSERARNAGAKAVVLTTTNDNLDAIAFYESVGFEFVTCRVGAVDDARRTLKPSIPTHAPNGLPIRDELEFRRRLR